MHIVPNGRSCGVWTKAMKRWISSARSVLCWRCCWRLQPLHRACRSWGVLGAVFLRGEKNWWDLGQNVVMDKSGLCSDSFSKTFVSLVMACWGHWIWGSCRRWFHKPSCAKIELFQSAEPILIGSKGESVVHRGWKTYLTSLDMSERLDCDIRKLQRLKSPRPPNSISATSDIRCGREVLRKREGAQGAVIAPSFGRWNCFKFQACNQNAVFGWISTTFFVIHEAEGRESTVDSSWNVFSHLWSPLPYPTTIIFVFWDVFFPDLPWCVMKQLGEIAAEVVDDAVTTTGISLDALHTPWPSVPGWCWKVSACRWCV